MVGLGRAEIAATVGSAPVVVSRVLSHHDTQVAFAQDQHPVCDLGPGGEHEPLRKGVGPHRQQHLIQMIGTDVCG